MPAVIECPECDKRFKGKPGLEGKRIRCPACGHDFTVPWDDEDEDDGEARPAPKKKKPAAEGIKAAAPAAAPKPAPPAPPPANSDDDEGDPKYGITDLDLAPRCPNCTKEMEPGAIICLFCGYNTQTRVLGRTVKTVAKTGGEHFLYLLPGLSVALCMFSLIVLNLYFYFEFPQWIKADSWVFMFAHESVKFWVAILSLAGLWAMGIFCFKRLVLEPTPPEEVKD